jgi:hypothetical protein
MQIEYSKVDGDQRPLLADFGHDGLRVETIAARSLRFLPFASRKHVLTAFSRVPGDLMLRLMSSPRLRICLSENDSTWFPKKGVKSNISVWKETSRPYDVSRSISGSKSGKILTSASRS